MPFRDAHAVVGKIVSYAIKQEKTLPELTLEELRKFSSRIDKDIYDHLELKGSVTARDHIGGTAPAQVKRAVRRARTYLKGLQKKV